MIGTDYKTAQIELRERISLTASGVQRALKGLKAQGLCGIILSTCNRTELYLASNEVLTKSRLKQLFFAMGETDFDPQLLPLYFYRDQELKRYLFELACGLHSMILGEDQIITQVGDAAALGIECKAGCPELNTLFRHAVTCAKKAKTQVALKQISPSIVSLSIKRLAPYFQKHKNPSVLIIGNGEMGRLAAKEFTEAGCSVCMTLRSYKYTETVIPAGCSVIPYDGREELLEKSDIVVSATKSPHHTLELSMVEKLKKKPAFIFDLALPRDIDPKIRGLSDICCYDVDDLGSDSFANNREAMEKINLIISEQLEKYGDWLNFQQGLYQREELAI